MSAITLGTDPIAYAFAVVMSTMFFMAIGLIDVMATYQHITNLVYEERATKFMTFNFSLSVLLVMVFLIHGSILAGIIIFYQDAAKNVKDNVVLYIQCLFLGLNLLDFAYKLWVSYYITNLDVTLKLNVSGKENEGENPPKTMNSYRYAMYVIQGCGIIAYAIGTASYLWVGAIASDASMPRSMLLSSAIIICIFLIVSEGLKYAKNVNLRTINTGANLLGRLGVKLPELQKTGTNTKVQHKPLYIKALKTPLTDDNPLTPLILHAAQKAATCSKAGINETEFCIRQDENNQTYIVSPQNASLIDKAHRYSTGPLHHNKTGWLLGATNEKSFYGDDSHFVSPNGENAAELYNNYQWYNNTPMFLRYNTNMVPYTIMTNKVFGVGIGLGIYLGIHNWFPCVLTLYNFAFYCVLLRNGEAALLAWFITTVPAFFFAMLGRAGQHWELFRWNMLIGWSIILLVPKIVANSSAYILQTSSWTNVAMAWQTEPTYTNLDNSTTAIGFTSTSLTYSAFILLVVLVSFIAEKCANPKINSTKVKPVTTNGEEENKNLIPIDNPTSTNLRSRNVKPVYA